jgi:hypothetical protein
MKYVVIRVDHGDVGREIPVIFPESLVHSLVADAIMQMEGVVEFKPRVVSAGEVFIDDGIDCLGGSETLGVKSRGRKDDILIRSINYMHGIVMDEEESET